MRYRLLVAALFVTGCGDTSPEPHTAYRTVTGEAHTKNSSIIHVTDPATGHTYAVLTNYYNGSVSMTLLEKLK